MSRMRSPGYPSLTLEEAIDLVEKIHEANRTNPIDRAAAAIDMGYTGLTGRSAKLLSDLSHFGLLEKAGKGGVRVSRRAVDILHPDSPEGRLEALHEAASSPTLFGEMNAHFSEGAPSANSLRSYLMRNGFASVAIPPIVKSYLETYQFLTQETATESHGGAGKKVGESVGLGTDPGAVMENAGNTRPARDLPTPPPVRHSVKEVQVMEGERVIFVDEAGPGRYLKLIASGALDADLLGGLEDFTNRLKGRLGVTTTKTEAADAKATEEPQSETTG